MNAILQLRVTVLAVALCSPPSGRALQVIGNGGWPPSAVSFAELPWGQRLPTVREYGACEVSVFISLDGTTQYTYGKSYLLPGAAFGCPKWGVTDVSGTSGDIAARVLTAASPVPYLKEFKWHGLDECLYRVRYGVGSAGAAINTVYEYPCTYRRGDVNCQAHLPGGIEHTPALTGRVTRREETVLRVACDQVASINVSVASPDLLLRDGGHEIASRFYVNSEGQTNYTTVVQSESHIPLLSIVETTVTAAGAYAGNAIVMVSWD